MSNTITLAYLREAQKCRDFNELIKKWADKYGDHTAFILKKMNGKEASYTNKSFIDLKNDVEALASSYIKRGFVTRRIAIIGENKYQWILTYLTQMFCGAISVPLDKGLEYKELEHSLRRSSAEIIVYDKKYQSVINQFIEGNLLQANNCICMDDVEDANLTVNQLINEGRELIAKDKSILDSINIDPNALAIILFTSGTTAMAKAVMLSQDNIMTNIYDMDHTEDIRTTDVNMAFLPYHHSFGCTGQLVMLNSGATTTYCDGLRYIQKNLVEYKVSVFVCVPLLIESIYKKIIATAKKSGQEKKLNFGKKLSKMLLAIGIDVRRKIFKSVLDQLGGELRLVISGASSIEPETLEGFKMFGIETINGYGMTEAAPVIASENRDNQRSGSIGKAMPSVEVKLKDPDSEGIGELLAKGPNVMLGYYDNEEATSDTIVDGWLHTGDLARIDKDGFIFICGKKKNVIVLKNGKNVFPEEIELLASELPYVAESFVFALPNDNDEGKLILYIKIVYNKAYFKDNNIDEENIEGIIKADIEKLNNTMPNYKRIHNVISTDKPMIKTTSNKVKRFEEIEVIKKELQC